MSEIKDGGAAFPVPEPGIETGMTLRDYFAAKAMHAIYMRFGGGPSAGNDYDGCLTHAAKDAYAMADAMLKAREE